MKQTTAFRFLFAVLFITVFLGGLSAQSYRGHHGGGYCRGGSSRGSSSRGGGSVYGNGWNNGYYQQDRGASQSQEISLEGELSWDRGDLFLTTSNGEKYLILVSRRSSRLFDQIENNQATTLVGFETGEEFDDIRVFDPTELTQEGDTYLF